MKFILLFLIVNVTTLFVVFASVTNPISNLSYIEKLSTIRIAASSGSGNGHQSMDATVMTKLRQLDDKSEIEII